MKIMKSALLVMDAQNITLKPIVELPVILERINSLTAEARRVGMPVIFVKVGFRNNYPEVHENNIIFSYIKENEVYQKKHETSEIHDAVLTEQTDIIVYKKRLSAFSGNDLEIILRSNRIENLVLTGFWTSGVVLSTVLEAFDKDYKLQIINDCCSDPEKQTNDFLFEKIFASKGEIIDAETWIASIN